MESDDNILGQFLKNARATKGMTLRGVEDAIGVSNAYLSQVESGKIQRPSPAILFKLSGLYNISYALVMGYAGHPVPGDASQHSARTAFHERLGSTTSAEEEAILDYLQYLRSRRTRRGS